MAKEGNLWEGFLVKKGSHGKSKSALKSWKRRYFTISAKNCFYYEGARESDGTGRVPKGVMVGGGAEGRHHSQRLPRLSG